MDKVQVYKNGIKFPKEVADLDIGTGEKLGDFITKTAARLESLEKENKELRDKSEKQQSAILTLAADLDKAKQVIIEQTEGE